MLLTLGGTYIFNLNQRTSIIFAQLETKAQQQQQQNSSQFRVCTSVHLVQISDHHHETIIANSNIHLSDQRNYHVIVSVDKRLPLFLGSFNLCNNSLIRQFNSESNSYSLHVILEYAPCIHILNSREYIAYPALKSNGEEDAVNTNKKNAQIP